MRELKGGLLELLIVSYYSSDQVTKRISAYRRPRQGAGTARGSSWLTLVTTILPCVAASYSRSEGFTAPVITSRIREHPGAKRVFSHAVFIGTEVDPRLVFDIFFWLGTRYKTLLDFVDDWYVLQSLTSNLDFFFFFFLQDS